MCWKITVHGSTQTRFMRIVFFCIFLFSKIINIEDLYKKFGAVSRKECTTMTPKAIWFVSPFVLFIEVGDTIPLGKCNFRATSVLCWFWDKTSVMIFHFAFNAAALIYRWSGSVLNTTFLTLFNPCKKLHGG